MFKNACRAAGCAIAMCMAFASNALAQVVINEIHHHPAIATLAKGEDPARLEFLELFNSGTAPIDLSGWSIAQAVTFTFPDGTSMAPGEYLVVARDPAFLKARVPSMPAGVRVLGWTSGDLSGGSVQLLGKAQPTVTMLDAVAYSEKESWLEAADGSGSSLELVDPMLDNASDRVWRASLSPNGTPGAANSRLGEPVVIAETPARETSGIGVTQIAVTFSSEVRNVAAASLTVDGATAKSVTGTGAGPYVFTVDPPKTGISQIVIGAGVIETADRRAFVGDKWQYFSPPTATLSMPDDANGGTGATVHVPISAAPANNILGIDMTLAYDPAVLTPQSVTASGIADIPPDTSFALEYRIPTPGVLIISEYALGLPLSGSGEVARVHFLVVGAPSTTSTLTFTSASINEDEIPVAFDPGLFTATCAGVPDGTACNDGDACTQMDTCQAGSCVGTNPVVCSADQCNNPGTCIPSTGVCSAPTPKTDGTSCGDAGTECTNQDTCQAGVCQDNGFKSTSTTCGDAGTACVNQDYCNGNGGCTDNGFKAEFTLCGDPDATFCNAPNSCDATGSCIDRKKASGTVCLTGTGTCDPSDTCDGTTNACVAVYAPASTACGSSSSGPCDNADTCDGSGTCLVNHVADGTSCGDTGTQCTNQDTCLSGACHDNGFQAEFTLCGDPDATFCNAADSCDATGSCVDRKKASGTVCLTGTGTCDPSDTCDGTTNACVAVLTPNGTSCTDGNACTQTDTCQAGTCVGSNPIVCNDNNTCTDDSCNTLTGACVYVANDGNSCTDGNVCTSDACSSGACVHAASGACSVGGTVYYYRDGLFNAGAGTEPSTKPVPNVGIDRTQDAVADVTTGSDGTYAFGSVFGNVSITTVNKYGSPRASDHNGAISGTDAAKIARGAVGLDTLTTNQRLAGDVTGNGTISALDAAQVARFAALLVDHFDVAVSTGSDWKFRRCDAYAFPGDPGCGLPSYNFTPVSQAEAGKNFYAVLYGDVTGNWAPAAFFSSAQSAEPELADGDRAELATVPSAAATGADATRPDVVRSASAAPAVISIDGLAVPLRLGERRQLTIAITSSDGILGLDLSLNYDPSRIAIVGVQSAGIAAGWGVAHADQRGVHRISTYGVTPLAGSGTVLTVTVEGRADAGRATPIALSAVANEGAIPLRTRGQSLVPHVGTPRDGDR